MDETLPSASAERRRMVEIQIRGRGVRDPRVLAAMAQGPAPPLRPRGHARLGLRRRASADRRGPDDLPALHRRLHDRGPAACGEGRGSSRSGPARATRRPSWPRSPAEVFTIELVEALSLRAQRTLAALGYAEHPLPRRRRRGGLARGGAVRRDHRHGRGGPGARGARARARPVGDHDRSRRDSLPGAPAHPEGAARDAEEAAARRALRARSSSRGRTPGKGRSLMNPRRPLARPNGASPSCLACPSASGPFARTGAGTSSSRSSSPTGSPSRPSSR